MQSLLVPKVILLGLLCTVPPTHGCNDTSPSPYHSSIPDAKKPTRLYPLHMPARSHPPISAQYQSPAYPAHSESPLRKVQLQSEVRPSARRALRSVGSDDANRRKASSALQQTIYSALGSSEPVDLLPHISKRAALLRRGTSDPSSDGSLTTSAPEDTKTEINTTDSGQPPTPEEQTDPESLHDPTWVLDEVLYATPPGCGNEDTMLAWKHTNPHFVTRIDGDDHVETFAQHKDTQRRAEARA